MQLCHVNDAGAVDNRLESPKVFGRLVNRLAKLIFIRQITLQKQGLPAAVGDAVDDFPTSFGLDIHHGNPGTLVGK